MGDVTRILEAIDEGDPSASEELLPIVYDELRRLAAQKLAHERPGQTLDATALVHEAYVRLVDAAKAQQWNSRGHFFSAAAEAMRRILIERARAKRRVKRRNERVRVDIDTVKVAVDTPADELIELDEALDRLDAEYPDCGDLVKLRFFAGMSLADAASALGISRRSADRYWAYARAWLHNELK